MPLLHQLSMLLPSILMLEFDNSFGAAQNTQLLDKSITDQRGGTFPDRSTFQIGVAG